MKGIKSGELSLVMTNTEASGKEKAKMENPDILSCLANLSNDEVFTPPELANKILDLLPGELWANSEARFLDPCSKTGVFLREIAKRLKTSDLRGDGEKMEVIEHILEWQVFGIATSEMTKLLTMRSVYCASKADGQYSIISTFKGWSGNVQFPRATAHKFGANGKCLFCPIKRSDFIEGADKNVYAYPFIHEERVFNEMKFDLIVGNPPYQISDGGKTIGSSASPVYQLFVEKAIQLTNRYVAMIIPARWYSAGKGLESFRSMMLNCGKISKIVDFQDSTDCFKGVNINGGVMYFLYDKQHVGDCLITNFKGQSAISQTMRPLIEPEFKARENWPEVFLRENITVGLYKKMMKQFLESQYEFMSSVVSSRKPFGIPTNFRGYTKDKVANSLKTYIWVDGKRKSVYVGEKEITNGIELIPKWKVLVANAGDNGRAGRAYVIAKSFLAAPNEICSETYLVLGSFNSKEEAQSLLSYSHTTFFRFLVAAVKNSQHVIKSNYRCVPVLPFNQIYDDQFLFEKFGINQSEVRMIKERIKEFSDSEKNVGKFEENEQF